MKYLDNFNKTNNFKNIETKLTFLFVLINFLLLTPKIWSINYFLHNSKRYEGELSDDKRHGNDEFQWKDGRYMNE